MPCTRRRCLAYLSTLPGLAAASGARTEAWPPAQAVPSLRLPALDGGERSLADWRGRVLLLNFWASWCEPCAAELPSLLRLAEARADAGLSVVCVNYQEGEAKIRRFLDTVLGELPAALPVLLDRDGAAAKAWTGRIFPTSVLVDRRGRPVVRVVGELNWTGAEAARLLEPLLRART